MVHLHHLSTLKHMKVEAYPGSQLTMLRSLLLNVVDAATLTDVHLGYFGCFLKLTTALYIGVLDLNPVVDHSTIKSSQHPQLKFS